MFKTAEIDHGGVGMYYLKLKRLVVQLNAQV